MSSHHEVDGFSSERGITSWAAKIHVSINFLLLVFRGFFSFTLILLLSGDVEQNPGPSIEGIKILIINN